MSEDNTPETEVNIKDLTDQELRDRLSGKREAFLEAYLSNGFNGTQAALDVYATDNVSSASSIASENLRILEIKELKRRRMESMAMKTDEALARLGQIARGDLGDFLEVTEDGTISISLQKAKDLNLTHLIKKVKTKKIPEVDTETGDILHTVEAQVELYSSHDALRDICRTLGLFTDNINAQIDGVVGVMKTGPEMDPEDWAKQMATYRKQVESEMNNND